MVPVTSSMAGEPVWSAAKVLQEGVPDARGYTAPYVTAFLTSQWAPTLRLLLPATTYSSFVVFSSGSFSYLAVIAL